MKKLAIYSVCFLSMLCSFAIAQDDGEVMSLLQDLVANPRNQVDQSQSGWIIIDSNQDHSRYFFTSSVNDPAHPAVFKQRIYQSDGTIHMDLSDICQGEEKACSEYREYFENMRRQLRTQFQSRPQSKEDPE